METNDLLPDNAPPTAPEEKDLELTLEQKELVKKLWNTNPSSPPGLKEITNTVFSGDFDGRSKEGRAVKKYLASLNLRAKATSDFIKRDKIELTEDQKLFVTNNAANNTAVEMAREIFNKPTLTNLNAETIAVNDFMKTLDTKLVFKAKDVHDVPSGTYEPPETFDKVFKKVNTYVNFQLNKDKLTAAQKKNLEMLINYLHVYRFINQMNTYETESDRRLCEDAFIRATYDKPDLAQEEVDQYIEYANQVVQGAKVLRRSLQLQNMLEETSNANDVEHVKISMGLVEAIGKASTEYNQCKIRENKLLTDLKQKRSDRMSKQLKESASILNLVEQWKQEETRIEWLRIGELEEKIRADEVERLSNLPELKARIMGPSKQAIIK